MDKYRYQYSRENALLKKLIDITIIYEANNRFLLRLLGFPSNYQYYQLGQWHLTILTGFALSANLALQMYHIN